MLARGMKKKEEKEDVERGDDDTLKEGKVTSQNSAPELDELDCYR